MYNMIQNLWFNKLNLNQFKIGFENNLLNDIFMNKKDVSKEKEEILFTIKPS